LLLLESFEWIGMHGGEFIIFGPKVQKILNFESFLSLTIFFKSENLIWMEIGFWAQINEGVSFSLSNFIQNYVCVQQHKPQTYKLIMWKPMHLKWFYFLPHDCAKVDSIN
jgi:hypothetical protein